MVGMELPSLNKRPHYQPCSTHDLLRHDDDDLETLSGHSLTDHHHYDNGRREEGDDDDEEGNHGQERIPLVKTVRCGGPLVLAWIGIGVLLGGMGFLSALIMRSLGGSGAKPGGDTADTHPFTVNDFVWEEGKEIPPEVQAWATFDTGETTQQQ